MNAFGNPVFGTVVDETPVVVTQNGAVRGKTSNGIAVFRGIPYGGNCDENRRWLPPVKADNWEGTLDCFFNGPMAMQVEQTVARDSFAEKFFTGGRYDDINAGECRQDENCLVLNVVTPNLSNSKLPVLFYIHGGGFGSGSGKIIFAADDLAREQNIVLVSVNHRLNVFGFLDLSSFDNKYKGSGNAGLLDLVLALEWVRDNIAAFGGDPDQVTIMGESGGAMKVSNLLAMERANGLFLRAIIESGSAPVGTTTQNEAAKNAAALLTALNITTLEDLLALPAETIRDAFLKLEASKLASFSPVGDDHIIPSNPEGKYSAPEISKKIPMMVGASQDELGIYGIMPDISWEQLRDALLQPETLGMGLSSPVCLEENVDAVIAAARKGNTKNESPGHTFIKILSSNNFLAGGAYHQALAKARQGGAPVYNYFITYDSPNLRGSGEDCSWHTADLVLQMRIVHCPECEYISKMLAAAIGAFVRSGDPSTPDMQWPAFTERDPHVMLIDEPWRVELDPTKDMREAWGDDPLWFGLSLPNRKKEASNAVSSDAECIAVRNMVMAQQGRKRPPNSFDPESETQSRVRSDGVRYVNDIRYGTQYPNSYLDLWYPDDDTSVKRPVIVYFHGGGFIFGDKMTGDPMAVSSEEGGSVFVELLKEDVNIVSAAYAFAPEYRCPTQLHQVNEVLGFLNKNHDMYGLDMSRVILMGGSAGAVLISVYGLILSDADYAAKMGILPLIAKEQIKALVIDEAPLNVTEFHGNMAKLFMTWIGDEDMSVSDMAHLLEIPKHIKGSYPPSFIIGSNIEHWFEESAKELHDVLELYGVENVLYSPDQSIDKLEHGYLNRFATNQCAKECLDKMLVFIRNKVNS